MRIAYVQEERHGRADSMGPQPRADAEVDWAFAVAEAQREGTLRRMHMEREGNVLKRAEFDGPDGPIVVSLIDDGSW